MSALQVQFNVKAIVLNKSGQFLALKRAYTNQKWDLPGGAVKLPEKHDVAIRREIYEETGLHVGELSIIDLQTVLSDDNEYMIVAALKCRATTGVLSLSREHTAYRWLRKREFLKLDATSYLKEIISRAL